MRNHSTGTQQRYESIDLKCLIIDFSALSYIDPSGVSSLKLLIDDFNKLSINVYISGASCMSNIWSFFHFEGHKKLISMPSLSNFYCIGPAYDMMKKCGLNEKPDSSFNFFPTIHDAVHQALDNLVPISVITETA